MKTEGGGKKGKKRRGRMNYPVASTRETKREKKVEKTRRWNNALFQLVLARRYSRRTIHHLWRFRVTPRAPTFILPLQTTTNRS